MVCAGALIAVSSAFGATSPLDGVYSEMYNLQFEQAHKSVAEYERAHPEDPMGPVTDAAAYLFSEFDRLHILQSEFFTDDANFRTKERLDPDPAVKQRFDAALDRARELCGRILAHSPGDANAQFATIMRMGLDSDYQALIEKKYLASLREMNNGRMLAEQLVAHHPQYYDAYLAIGVENYMLSLKPAPIRWLLRLGGAETNQQEGLAKLRLTAEKGHYLAPFARLLLAVAALRNHDREHARALLAGLVREFPSNRLYKRELARLS
jgi:hypothetical protein